MLKVLIFASKKADISWDDFISLYENQHLKLTDNLVHDGIIPPMIDYRRNYLLKEHALNIGTPPSFDVVTEVWFKNETDFIENRNGLSIPSVAEMVMQDMNTFLDLSTLTYVITQEYIGTPASRE